MKLTNSFKRKIKGIAASVAVAVSTLTNTAYADIAGSKIATGTAKLVSDATSWLLVIAPSVSVLLIIYYLIRKGMSDEMEHKKWNSRIVVTIVSCIGAVVASVLINVLVGYYN